MTLLNLTRIQPIYNKLARQKSMKVPTIKMKRVKVLGGTVETLVTLHLISGLTRPQSVFGFTNLRLFFMISVFTGGLGAAGFGAW